MSQYGYWFAKSDILPHGDGRRVVIGETLRVNPPLIMCEHGLHASKSALDALYYAPGNLLYKVVLSGDILFDTDKMCATERTAVAVIDAEPLLRLFVRRQALAVIDLWDAPDLVREYLETGNEEIRAVAEDAAWSAVESAARNAAKAAAWAAARVAGRKMFDEMVEEAFT